MPDITNLPILRYIGRELANFSDNQKIANIKKGNTNDFGDLYLKYIDRIYRYVYFRVGQKREVAEDITEVTFHKAFERIKMFDPGKGSLQSWLFRIAHNSLIDHYRSENGRVALKDSLPSEEDLEEKVQQKLDAESIQKAFEILTEEQKEIVLMRFVEDMDYKEISKVLHKSTDAIRATQYRAIKALKEKFNKK